MHFAFIPYGARQEVERLFRDMEAQKFQLKLTKKGEKDKAVFIPGQVRLLPLGVVEFIFPREYVDIILNTMLDNTAPNRYSQHKLYKTFMAMFRKVLGLKKLPEYKKKEKFPWTIQHVSIMPVGIREDGDLSEAKDMGYKDWWHEAI